MAQPLQPASVLPCQLQARLPQAGALPSSPCADGGGEGRAIPGTVPWLRGAQAAGFAQGTLQGGAWGGAGLARGRCCPHPVSLDGQVLAIRKDPKLEGALSGLVPQPAMRSMQCYSPAPPSAAAGRGWRQGMRPHGRGERGEHGAEPGAPAAPARRGGKGWCDGSCCFRMVPGVPCSPGHTASTWGKLAGGPMSGTWVSATALARDGSCLRLWHRRHGENHVRAEGRCLHGEMWPE